jgi:hypothetical protein
LLLLTHGGTNDRPLTEQKKMIVMLIKKINGAMSSEWVTDARGFAVEFSSVGQIEAQIKMMRQSDPSIVDFVIE